MVRAPRQRRKLQNSDLADIWLRSYRLYVTSATPRCLSSINCQNFDKRPGVLTIGKDKAGRDRKVSLPNSTAAFINEQSADKLLTAPLIAAVMAASGGKMPNGEVNSRRARHVARQADGLA